MAQADNVTVLRIQLDEGKTQDQLKQLTLDLEATRKAQQALAAERKASNVTDEQFAKQSVELKTKLRAQTQEYGALQKNLELYRKAQAGEADQYAATQAALSLAIRQQQQLVGSANNSSEASQALTKQIAEYRAILSSTDEQQGAFFRSIGKYPAVSENIEPLIARLVQLQEVEKQLPVGSAQAIAAQKEIGFQFGKVNEAAAAAGLAQKDVTSKLNDYGERLRPISADLAKLTIAQDAAAQSAGKDSAEYAKIGFAIGAARQEIAKVPAELAKVPTAGDTAKKSLLDAAKSTGLYGQSVERGTKFVGQFKQGLDLLKGGFKGVQTGEEAAAEGSKVLKIGLIEIGIGILLVALSALISYFTQSAEGAKILGGITSAIGATFQALTDIVTGTGKAIFQVLSGDFKGAGETVAKTFDGVGKKIADAAVQGYKVVAMEKELAKSRRELEVEDVKEQSRVAVLIRLSKERGKTSQEQLAALKEAGEIEASITQKNIDQQQKELDLINLKIKLKGSASKGDLLQQKADKDKEIAQALASQDELNAKIKVRQSVFLEEQRQRGLDDNKAYYEARAAQAVQGTQAEVSARVAVLQAEREKQLGAVGLTENQRRAIIENSEKQIRDLRRGYAYASLQQVAALEQLDIDRHLLAVQAGSEQELALQREKLTVQRNLELAAVGLTVAQARTIRETYLANVEKLERDSFKARALAAYQAEVDSVAAELTLAQKGTQQETELRVEAINTQLAKELAALDKRQDNTARAALLRANAEKAIQDARYGAAQAATEKFIQGERTALDEQLAKGALSQKAYDKAVLDSDVQGAQQRLSLAKTFGQQADALEQQFTTAKIAKIKSVTEAERAEQAKRIDTARTLTGSLVDLFQETIATTGEGLESFSRRALILLIDSVEKSILASQIEIIAKSFASTDSIATFGIAGFAKSAAIIAAVAGASEILKSQLTAPAKQFAHGTVLGGASHAQGGVQLYSRTGHHFGEAEAGEVVLTKGVWQNPVLRPVASWLNVAGGGAPLLPRAHLALGGIMRPVAQAQLASGQPIDYERLAQATAAALRQSPPVTRISDVKAGLERDRQTQRLANS